MDQAIENLVTGFGTVLNMTAELDLEAYKQQIQLGLILSLVMTVVVAPVALAAFKRVVTRWNTAAIGVFLAMLIMCVGNVGLNLWLRYVIPVERMSNTAISTLSLIIVLTSSYLIARYVVWVLDEPGKPQWVIDEENLPPEMMTPFDQRRHEYFQRRRSKQKL